MMHSKYLVQYRILFQDPLSLHLNTVSNHATDVHVTLQVLASYDVWSLNKWVDLAILIAWIVFYRAIFLGTLKLKERMSL